MSFLTNPLIMRQIIVDHYKNPVHGKIVSNQKYINFRSKSSTCVDDIIVQLFVENNFVKDANFTGEACAICKSSTDIVAGLIIDQLITSAIKILDNYLAMITNGPYDQDLLKEALVFVNVHKQQHRIKCAVLGPRAFLTLLKKY